LSSLLHFNEFIMPIIELAKRGKGRGGVELPKERAK